MPAAVTVSSILDTSAVLLNDPLRAKFTYAVMLPFFRLAYKELEGYLQENNVALTNKVSTTLDVPSSTLITTLTQASTPAYPADLIDIRGIYERDNGTTDDFVEMRLVDFLPNTEQQASSFGVYSWQGQEIKLPPCSGAKEIKIEYLSTGLTTVTSEVSTVNAFNAANFLTFRTAALCAMYLDNAKELAGALNSDANTNRDTVINIATKGSQVKSTRHASGLFRR